MFLIIGLGNPGKRYEKTRHNLAWIIFDILNKNLDWQTNKYVEATFAVTSINDIDIILVKPDTFMNESGKILNYFEKEFKITDDNLILIHDDIDLPLNKIKISYDCGDGGHNGVINYLGSQSFIRIRVGISIVDENGEFHKPNVLSKFSKKEIEIINDEVAPNVAKILEMIITKGKESAMNKFNIK